MRRRLRGAAIAMSVVAVLLSGASAVAWYARDHQLVTPVCRFEPGSPDVCKDNRTNPWPWTVAAAGAVGLALAMGIAVRLLPPADRSGDRRAPQGPSSRTQVQP